MYKRKITDIDRLEKDLLRVYSIINKIPTKDEYIKYGNYSIESYATIDKWIFWCRKVFPNHKRTNSMKIPEKDLIDDLKRVSQIVGCPPSKAQYVNYGRYSIGILQKVKSWDLLMDKFFGCSYKSPNKKISDEELIKNLVEMKTKLGRTPKKEDLRLSNGSKYSANAYRRAFGTITNALKKAGFEVKQKYFTDNELLDELKRVYRILGHTPSMEEFGKHSILTNNIYRRFESWTKALLAADIPVAKAHKIDTNDILEALRIWYNKNNNNTRCLEYWKIRKAKERGEFPYSTISIKSKIDGTWEEIMQQIDPNYKTTNQFVKRGVFVASDGNTYLSSIERTVANILYYCKRKGRIADYEYEAKICNDKSWTCDFRVALNNKNNIWVEVDGMRDNRKDPYDSGQNEKIEYYKSNNFNYFIVDYRCNNIKTSIYNLIEVNNNG